MSAVSLATQRCTKVNKRSKLQLFDDEIVLFKNQKTNLFVADENKVVC